MPRNIRTEILIQADAASVWAVIADLPAHARWDPFLVSIAGELKVGQRLEVKFKSGQTARPIVTEVHEGRVFEWLGKLYSRWIFSARHRFELVAEGTSTRLIHSETFTGVLVPFLGGTLRAAERGFDELNAALKERVEREAHGTEARADA